MSTIAVVDDSRATLERIEGILSAASYRVVTYDDPSGLEEQLEELAPNLVLLDVVMPTRNGYEVLRKLRMRQLTASIPVVLVSSKGEPADVKWGLRQGATGYLPKPFSDRDLLEAVGGALGVVTENAAGGR